MRIALFNDRQPTLKELQEIVEGYIEVINLPGDIQMIVNEEGKLYDLDINLQASILAKQTIVGNVALLTGTAQLK